MIYIGGVVITLGFTRRLYAKRVREVAWSNKSLLIIPGKIRDFSDPEQVQYELSHAWSRTGDPSLRW